MTTEAGIGLSGPVFVRLVLTLIVKVNTCLINLTN